MSSTHPPPHALPKVQKAAIKSGQGKNTSITVQEIPVETPGPDQILVKIRYSGLCGSDKCMLYDEWGPRPLLTSKDGARGVGGHEGAGVVVAVGSNMQGTWRVGDRAGIKWIASVCDECEFCTDGMSECHCPKQVHSGLEVPGTFQQYCLTDGKYATRIPEGVEDEEAGPLMCGGLASYVAVKRSEVKAGQWIAIVGAGGGTGHLGLQYARAMGMRVIAIDRGSQKKELCLKLGAEHFIDFTTDDVLAEVMRITTYGAHGVYVATNTRAAYEMAPHLLRPKGTAVCTGLPRLDDAVVAGMSAAVLVRKAIKIVGSVVGTREEADEVLQYTAKGLVRPVLTMGGLEDISRLCEEMDQQRLAGRAVIRIPL